MKGGKDYVKMYGTKVSGKSIKIEIWMNKEMPRSLYWLYPRPNYIKKLD